jgi:hypothetical protein
MRSWSEARSWIRRSFVRIAVDWLLRSDIGQVIKTIVDDETFPKYATPKKPPGEKKPKPKIPSRSISARDDLTIPSPSNP